MLDSDAFLAAIAGRGLDEEVVRGDRLKTFLGAVELATRGEDLEVSACRDVRNGIESISVKCGLDRIIIQSLRRIEVKE